MDNYFRVFGKKAPMGSNHMVVGVKQVKQEVSEEWDESMPLPGDIIEGFAESEFDELFLPAKVKSDLSSRLGKLSRKMEAVWIKVRRGENTIKLRAFIVPEKYSKLHRTRFTIRAASDNRHIAVLGDMTLDQCVELQEMSRKVVNVEFRGFNRIPVEYEWKMKADTYLPDKRSTVISSILFMPIAGEQSIEAITRRAMAWFSAATASGTPLVFVNIQTEQIVKPGKGLNTAQEGGQQNSSASIRNQLVQGIRLWFLPGIAEVSVELIPEPGESRFGLDIKRTDEGFICIFSVTKGTAADRAGLSQLHFEANATGYLLVISRLEGKSLMPSGVCSEGQISCCDHGEIKELLQSAIDELDSIHLHTMAWPNQTPMHASRANGAGMTLRPPNAYITTP